MPILSGGQVPDVELTHDAFGLALDELVPEAEPSTREACLEDLQAVKRKIDFLNEWFDRPEKPRRAERLKSLCNHAKALSKAIQDCRPDLPPIVIRSAATAYHDTWITPFHADQWDQAAKWWDSCFEMANFLQVVCDRTYEDYARPGPGIGLKRRLTIEAAAWLYQKYSGRRPTRSTTGPFSKVVTSLWEIVSGEEGKDLSHQIRLVVPLGTNKRRARD